MTDFLPHLLDETVFKKLEKIFFPNFRYDLPLKARLSHIKGIFQENPWEYYLTLRNSKNRKLLLRVLINWVFKCIFSATWWRAPQKIYICKYYSSRGKFFSFLNSGRLTWWSKSCNFTKLTTPFQNVRFVVGSKSEKWKGYKNTNLIFAHIS